MRLFKYLKEDLTAGITVALVLIPQSMAYAKLAGLPAYFGLYAAFLPPVIAAFFGSSPQLSTGPVAVLSLMTLAAVSPFADPGTQSFINYAIFLSLLLGVMMLLIGILRLGRFISFLSHPVIYGFTNAAAIIIASTQLQSFFGVTVPRHEKQYETVYEVFKAAKSAYNAQALVVGILALVLLALLKKINKKLPNVLIVVLTFTLATWFFNLQIPVIGSIPHGLPKFNIPQIDLGFLSSVFVAVITMTLIGFTESISISQAIAIKTKERVNTNKELIGQGLANIFGSFSQSYPSSGSFSRTALNFQAGAKTWASSLFTSITVLITLLFLTDLLFYIPQVVLAAVIVFSVSGLVNLKKFKEIWHTSEFDGIASVLTFLGTLYFAPDLEFGILIGVLFSIAYFIFVNSNPRIAFLSLYKDNYLHDSQSFNLDQCDNIAVVRLDAPLFFANATYFEDEVIKYLANHKRVKHILFVGTGINRIDATGEEMLAEFIDSLQNSGKEVYFCSLKVPVMNMFRKTNLIEKVGEHNFFSTTKEAVTHLLKHVNHEHSHIDKKHCPLSKFIVIPTRKMKIQKSQRNLVAHYYNVLFNK